MSEKKWDSKENLELAEEHIKLAQDLVLEEAKEAESGDKKNTDIKQFEKTAFTLEKAESQIKELSKMLAGVFIIGIIVIGSLLFSPNITGSAVNIPDKTGSFLGIILTTIIILVAYFLFTPKKKK